MVINLYMSVGRIPLHDITTIVGAASGLLKTHIVKKCFILY